MALASQPVLAGDDDRLPDRSPAPSFRLLDVQGNSRCLQDYKGHVLVLNFWAFWCDTWKEELPHLREIAERQADLGFQLVAISVDGTRLREYIKRTGGKLPFPVLLDPGGRVSRLYRVTRVPTILLIDPGARVRSVRVGFPGAPVILSLIRSIAGPRQGQMPAGRHRHQDQ